MSIPLIGYMVIFNENVLPYLQLSKTIFGEHAYPEGAAHVSARLIEIYFGLCFLAVGSIIYQLCCPAEVKRFGTAPDYIAAWRSHISDVTLDQIESKLAASSALMKLSLKGLATQHNVTTARGNEKYLLGVLEWNFQYLNENRWAARILVFFCDTGGGRPICVKVHGSVLHAMSWLGPAAP